jgi:hypothetical protein
MKTKLKSRFKRLYPGKRLLAVQLDGFSHAVVFDSGSRTGAVERDLFSHCMPEGNWTAQASQFFADIGNAGYQNSPKEIIYILPENR